MWRRSTQKEKFAKYSHYTHSQVTEQHKCRKNAIFWNITLCGTLKVKLRFGRTCHIQYHGRRMSQAGKQLEADRILTVIAINLVESGQLRQSLEMESRQLRDQNRTLLGAATKQ